MKGITEYISFFLQFLVKEEMLDEQDKCKDIQISQHHRNFQK
jgi:hypothetical protein